MMDFVELTPVGNKYVTIRRTTSYPNPPHSFGRSIARIEVGNVAESLPENSFVYLTDIIINGDVVAKAGDKWWLVYKANGTNLAEKGWVAEVYMGQKYLNSRLISTQPIPVPEKASDVPYTVILGDDITYIKQTITGILKAK